MLATTPSTHPSYTHTFTPIIPSPLSPRRHHIYAERAPTASTPRTVPSPLSYNSLFASPATMTTQREHQHSRETPAGNVPFGQRAIKTAPREVTRSDALRERRRDMFLKKVKREREDRRWDGRVEDMAHLDYRLEKSRWEAEQSRSAPIVPSDSVDDEETEWYGSNAANSISSSQMQGSQHWQHPSGYSVSGQDGQEDWEAETLLAQEERELEAMIAMMEGQEMDQGDSAIARETGPRERQGAGEMQTPYASDDEEYDSIFLDLIDHQAGQTQAQAQGVQHECGETQMEVAEGEEMDMS